MISRILRNFSQVAYRLCRVSPYLQHGL